MARGAGVNIPIVSDWDSKGIKKAVEDFKKLETTGQKVSFAMQKALLPATAAVAGLAAAATVATKAAIEDAKQQDELARQLKVTVGANDALVASVEDYIAQTETAAAVSDSELRPAFANLVRATGDVTEAQKLMTIALDVAAGTGKDLEGVTEALQEAIQGEVGPLKELDRSLTDVIASGADADEVMGILANTFGGAAAANTETVAGRFELMQIQIQNAQESIGMALLPVLERLLPILESVATFVAENTELFLIIGGVIGTVAGIVIAYNTALKLYAVAQGIATAATAVFNAVLAANPIVLIALAVAGLVTVLILLAKKFGVLDKIVAAVNYAFDKLGDAIKWLAGKFVDFINTLIDVANKIPFVEIGKITNVFEDQIGVLETATDQMQGYSDAELAVAEAAAEATYQQQLANLEYETAEKLMAELHPTIDDVEAAIGRTNEAMQDHIEAQEFINQMNTDLIESFDLLFGRFDNTQAVRNFSDAIDDAREAMGEFGAQSRQADEANQDVYRALANVIDQLDNIPAVTQLELVALLDQGKYDDVLAKIQVLNSMANTALTMLTAAEIKAAAGMVMPQSGFQNIPTPVSSIEIAGGAGSVIPVRQGSVTNPISVVINMPAGTDSEEVAKAIQKASRDKGTLIGTTSGTNTRI